MKEKSPYCCTRISNFCDLVEKQDRCQKLFNGVWTASSIQAWLYHTSNHNALDILPCLFLASFFESFWVFLGLFEPFSVQQLWIFLGSGKSKKLKLLKNLVKMEFYKFFFKSFFKLLDHLKMFYFKEKLDLLVKNQSWNRTSKRKTISEYKI